jgi:hypothetical protein
MPPSRNAPAPEPDAEPTGFSEGQRSELKALIAEAVGSATPPATPTPGGPPPKTDDEWDAMSDRQRESWVRSLVDHELDELARVDADHRRDAEIEALKNAQKPEPERPPSTISKLQKWLWGDQQEKP